MTSGDAMDIGDLRAAAATALSYVQNISYPANKEYLVERARSADAPTGVMEVFNLLPDREYKNSLDLMKEIDDIVLISAYKKNITGGLGTPGSA
jgi:hypothetical protein